MNKPVLKWSPAHPVRARDNLISSAAREKNQTGFKPTYESDSNEHMNFLMSNEYQKIWFKERSQYEKNIYSREETIKEESKIKRRVVQRMMTYRRPLKNDFIDDYIQKKKGNDPAPEQVVSPEKMKYRPDCHRKSDKHAKTTSKSQDTSGSKIESKEQTPAKGQKGKESKSQKGIGKAQKNKERVGKGTEGKETIRKGAEDDECDGFGEVLLVMADTAVNNECCKNK